jgi:hypothetical protein
MKRTAKLDNKTAQRCQHFGALGEQLAVEILLRNGVRSLNSDAVLL